VVFGCSASGFYPNTSNEQANTLDEFGNERQRTSMTTKPEMAWPSGLLLKIETRTYFQYETPGIRPSVVTLAGALLTIRLMLRDLQSWASAK
jgi:hypothetical protein